MQVVRIPNRADDDVMHSEVDFRDVERTRRRLKILDLHFLGFLHTHPTSRAVPGKGDIRGNEVGSLMFIYADCYEELRAFRRVHESPGYVEKRVLII